MTASAPAHPAVVDVDPFGPPGGGEWLRVSPKLARVRRLTTAISALVVMLVVAVPAWVIWRLWWPPVIAAAVVLPFFLWRFVRSGKWVRAWGYCERDEDLCVTEGLFTRRLTVVPFGRLQLVTVSAGPLLRSQGLATVKLITATAETRAEIQGLPAADAKALRDRLIEASDAAGSGL